MPPPKHHQRLAPDPGNQRIEIDASDASDDAMSRKATRSNQQATPVEPMGIDHLWKSITASRNSDGSVHIAADTFNLLNVMICDLQKVQSRLDKMATQLSRMDDLALKVEELSRNRLDPSRSLPVSPHSWDEVTKI